MEESTKNDAVERDNPQRLLWRQCVAQLRPDYSGAAVRTSLLTKRRLIMNANNKSILILSLAFLSVLLLASWPSPSMARERGSRGQVRGGGIRQGQKRSRNIESLRGARRAKTPGKALGSVSKARGAGRGDRRRGVGIGDHGNKGIASRRHRSSGRQNNPFRPQHNRRSRSHSGRNHRSRSRLGFGLGFGGHY